VSSFSLDELPERLSALQSRAEEAELRLKTVRKALRGMIRSFPDAAVVLNEDAEVVASNRHARRLAGVRRRLDRGRHILRLIRNPGFRDWLQAGGKGRVRFRSPAKADCWLEAQRVPYMEKQHLLLVRDATTLALADKTRADFVANASHELQTPLTVISGYLETMEEDAELSTRWRAPIHEMTEQCERMARLVRDLLELSRLESSEKAPKFAALDMQGILNDAAQVARARNHRELDIRVELESDRPLLGDEADIRSVAGNLANNAASFTPSGGQIALRWETGGNGGRLIVSDTGIGIAQEHLLRLTERFYRVRGEGRPLVDGTGLGLAIVKHALNRHGGNLTIESRPGEGSAFTCNFPLKRIGKKE